MEVMLRYVLHFPFRSLFQTRQRRGEGRGRFRRDTTRFTEVFRFVRTSLETPNLRGLKVPRVTTVIFLLSYFEVSCLWLLARSWSCLFIGVLIHFHLFFVFLLVTFSAFSFFLSLLRCSVCLFFSVGYVPLFFFFFFSFSFTLFFLFSVPLLFSFSFISSLFFLISFVIRLFLFQLILLHFLSHSRFLLGFRKSLRGTFPPKPI